MTDGRSGGLFSEVIIQALGVNTYDNIIKSFQELTPEITQQMQDAINMLSDEIQADIRLTLGDNYNNLTAEERDLYFNAA